MIEGADGPIPPPQDEAALAAEVIAAAERWIQEGAIPADPDARAKLDTLLTTAATHCRNAGLLSQATVIALYRAQIGLDRLLTDELSPEGRRRLFDAAWRLAEEALAGTSLTEDPIVWGQGNELAAELLWQHPDLPVDTKVTAAVGYLDRALTIYRERRERDRVAQCAQRLVQAMDHMNGEWNEPIVERYVFYLGLAGGVTDDSDDRASAIQLLLHANALARMDKAEHPELPARVRAFAVKSYELARKANDDATCAKALILVGNTLLASSPGASRADPDAGDCADLQRASAVFADGVQHAKNAGKDDLLPQLIRLHGIALGRRILHCDEPELFDAYVQVQRDAIALSTGADRASASVNLVGVAIEVFRRGYGIPLPAIREMIEHAETEVHGTGNTHLRAYLDSLETYFDELVFFGPKGMGAVRQLFGEDGQLASPMDAPDKIYFKVYEGRKSTPPATRPMATTLLLFLSNDGRAEGHMLLTRDGPSVNATFTFTCPQCGHDQALNLPILASFGGLSSDGERCERMVVDGVPCTTCGNTLRVQFAMTARCPSFSSKAVIVIPDSLQEHAPRVATQQSMIVCALHEAWSGEPVGPTSSIPWSGLPAIALLPAEHFTVMQRQMAIAIIVLALVGGDSDRLTHALRLHPPLWQGNAPVGVAEVTEALSSIGLPPGGTDFIRTTASINWLLETVRTFGPEEAVAKFSKSFQQVRETKATHDAALATAMDPAERHAFLEGYIAEAPDYSADRMNFLYETFLLGPEAELKAMEDKGLPVSDPLRYACAKASMDGLRAYMEQMIKEEQEQNSSAPAKALLKAALGSSQRFILLLRAFMLDVEMHAPSAALAAVALQFDDPRIKQRQITISPDSGRTMKRITEALAGRTDVLMIANVRDLSPPQAAKLFVTDIEWRELVFSLIAEATVIVMAVPANPAELPKGVSEEIAAIRHLKRSDAAILVLADPPQLSELAQLLAKEAEAPADATVPDGPVAHFSDFGFFSVLPEAAVSESPEQLVSAVEACLARAGGSPEA